MHQQLHLDYCGVGPEGAIKLAQLLSMPSSALQTLSLQGNMLGDDGLLHLSLGLARSIKLAKLNLSDNGIRHVRSFTGWPPSRFLMVRANYR